jgi:hypothetical protein
MRNSSLVIQGGNATTQATSPPPAPSPAPEENLQTAAREFRDAIRNNVRQEITAARARAAADAQAATPAPPLPPTSPRTITIRGSDGSQTVVGVPSGPFGNDDFPPQVADISIAFFLTVAAIIIGLPLARAFARRMDRRGGSAQVPNEIANQLSHLNQAVDAIALEVERISEGQRFTTRLLSEQRDAKQTLPSAAQR